MSYCRITGKAKCLPKPNYFPILPPISPADARRFCRITGKAYGLPSHHFIPVILTTYSNTSRCRITNSTEYGHHCFEPEYNYGRRKHIILADYRYMFPIFDESDNIQRDLIELLNSKSVKNEEQRFVYPVKERKCSLVFPAKLEAAVRDGDVRDVMFAKSKDSVLLRMKKGGNVSLELQDYNTLDAESVEKNLFDGEGPREDVVIARELEEHDRRQKQTKRKGMLSNMARIFETREHAGDAELLEQAVICEAKRQKTAKLNDRSRKMPFNEFNIGCSSQDGILPDFLTNNEDVSDLVKPIIESWDQETYQQFAMKSKYRPRSTKLPSPCIVKATIIDTKSINIANELLSGTVGFDAVSCVVPLSPLTEKLKPELIRAIKEMSEPAKEELLHIEEQLASNPEVFELIPHKTDIAKIMDNYKNGVITRIGKLPGLSIQIEAGRKAFLPGQEVSTSSGNVFIPGHSVSTPGGVVYVPGITVKTQTGLSFIPGAVMQSNAPFFKSGQIIDNEFVGGQTVLTRNGPRFLKGHTVLSSDGIKFIAGVIDESTGDFVCGQILTTPDGETFFPGQTITMNDSGEKFIPGQSTFSEKAGWLFTPGQVIDQKFVAGKSIISEEGSKFVPGQYADDIFVPGSSLLINGILKFVPGLNVETKQGSRFIEGQIVYSEHGDIFMPGKSTLNGGETSGFAVARTVGEFTCGEPIESGFVIDSSNADVFARNLSVYGHMVQTKNGIEFYPGKIDMSHLPDGKVIPGKLIKQDMDTKFVPGIMKNNGFIPGQVVWTENGERFVPGQVIETTGGLKFVPGQVIETHHSSKFVPGQTVDTPDGPRFIPGQIVQTKAGPTFIPGQVINTEDGGECFVPGQVVDTEDGPRFVPGKVLENGDKVTFVPGQIVQTDEGPRFVAPDLSSDEDGDQKFSVQSFLVTPEELKLLKSTHTWTTTSQSQGELSIDAKMLRQLSEAGMTIGRQIETSTVDIVLQSTKDAKTVQNFAKKFSINAPEQIDVLEKIFHEIRTIVNDMLKMSENGVIDLTVKQLMLNGKSSDRIWATCSDKKSTLIDTLVATIIDCVLSMKAISTDASRHHQSGNHYASVYEKISQTLSENVSNSNQTAKNDESVLQDLLSAASNLLASPVALEKLRCNVNEMVRHTIRISKVDLISLTINKNIYNDAEILNNVCAIFENENEDDMIEVIRELFEYEPKILYRIISNVKAEASNLTDDMKVINTVKHCIIAAVKDSVQFELKQIIEGSNSAETSHMASEYLSQAWSLAKALGLTDVAQILLDVMNGVTNEIGRKLQSDANATDLIERVIVMNKLAKNNPQRTEALRVLRCDPFGARKDARIRELLRRSGICTINPMDNTKLTNSNQVPISLFCSDNQLALEEFLIRRQTKSRGAFLIVKEGLQAVFPRESSRDVLTGKCAFTVLDENGIRTFEPLHVFSALKLNVASSPHRFSMYSCDFANEDNLEKEIAIPIIMAPVPQTKSAHSMLCDGLAFSNGYDRSSLQTHNYTDSLYRRRRREREINNHHYENKVNRRHTYYF